MLWLISKLHYDADSLLSGIELVECDYSVVIDGVHMGMTFAEIQDILGEIIVSDSSKVDPYRFSLRYTCAEGITLWLESSRVYLPTDAVYFVNYNW